MIHLHINERSKEVWVVKLAGGECGRNPVMKISSSYKLPIFETMTNRRFQIKQWLKEVLEDNLQDISYRAFIFGSQANKQELSRSDIDVGILADKEIPAINFVRISNAIEDLPMLYRIDLVDFANVEEKFKAVALQNVEWL